MIGYYFECEKCWHRIGFLGEPSSLDCPKCDGFKSLRQTPRVEEVRDAIKSYVGYLKEAGYKWL